MRIAKPVSHQNFERNLHFPRGVCLLECLFLPTAQRVRESSRSAGRRRSQRAAVAQARQVAEYGDGTHEAVRRDRRRRPGVGARPSHETQAGGARAASSVSGGLGRETSVSGEPESKVRVDERRAAACGWSSIGPPISQEYPLNLSI